MGTLNHTGRGGWTWKVAEFSNLNQSELNTSRCCISKWRTSTTYTEWRWMRSRLCVAQKPKERGSFLRRRRPEPFMVPVLAPHSPCLTASCLRGPLVLQTSATHGPTDSSPNALLSSHTVNTAWMRSIECLSFPTFWLLARPLQLLRAGYCS